MLPISFLPILKLGSHVTVKVIFVGMTSSCSQHSFHPRVLSMAFKALHGVVLAATSPTFPVLFLLCLLHPHYTFIYYICQAHCDLRAFTHAYFLPETIFQLQDFHGSLPLFRSTPQKGLSLLFHLNTFYHLLVLSCFIFSHSSYYNIYLYTCVSQ